MTFFKKIYNDLFSDNNVISKLLLNPVELPELPDVRSMRLPQVVEGMLDAYPDFARAIAVSPGLIDRLCRTPRLVHPLEAALKEIAEGYRRAIEETNRVIRTRIEQNESLRLGDCAPTWLKGYRARQYNDVFLRHDKMKSLLANSENDLTAGSEFKGQHPDMSYDRCYYVVLDGGIGWLVLSGSPIGVEGKIDICLGTKWLELKTELPETPFFRAETKTLFKSEVNQNIVDTLRQYWDGIRIGFMPEAPKEPNQLPETLPLSRKGCIQEYKERKIPYYSGAAHSGPEFWIDVHSNMLAWVPSEWQHMRNYPGSQVMGVVQMLSPMSGDGSTRSLQHRLRELSCERWTRWFLSWKKRAPAPPARLDRIPGWADVELHINRPMNEAQ
ncbi:hypothetical protein BB934_40940 (plasmid) [Microvirga ossetica]|uniref:Uncharacterized protein n=1 Tax=Microvirga ossetica TaxID=1882682 RepID=A0A1B2EX80_9HYPH|nr:hypothetical protein [Microvirga ossetica]ANY84556.1 hypothetical protein BB934_40940 [Microvirga ossetica]